MLVIKLITRKVHTDHWLPIVVSQTETLSTWPQLTWYTLPQTIFKQLMQSKTVTDLSIRKLACYILYTMYLTFDQILNWIANESETVTYIAIMVSWWWNIDKMRGG